MDDLKLLKALKNKILSLAMQGKLVKQDENDEPASILLEKIKKEKSELLKQGKLKKEKELLPISADEVPYKLPKSWKWVRLGEVCDVIMGQSPDSNSVNTNQDGLEFHQGKSYYTDSVISCSNTYTNKPLKVVDKNTILLSVRAPVGTINYTDRKICIGRGLCGINSLRNDMKYFYYILNNLENEFIKKATGTTFLAIGKEDVINQIIPLPPLAEQERIVAKIEEIFAIIDEIEKNITENKKLSKVLYNKILSLAMQGKLVKQNENDEPASILLKKIKEEKVELLKQGKIKKEKELPPIKADEVPYELPKSWQWVRLGEVCEIFKRAKSDKINLPLMDVKYLRTKQNPQIYTSGIVVYKDELIILVDGENSGEVFTVFEQGVLGSTLNILDINQNINKKYILFILFYFKDMFRKSKKGAAIPHLDKNLFKNLLIPLPPLEEQERIVAKIEEIKEIIDEIG